MKVTSKPLAVILIICFFAFIIGGYVLQVMWADWAIQRLFQKEYSWLQIFAALFLIELLAPKALQGISMIILFLMTLYIFLTNVLP